MPETTTPETGLVEELLNIRRSFRLPPEVRDALTKAGDALTSKDEEIASWKALRKLSDGVVRERTFLLAVMAACARDYFRRHHEVVLSLCENADIAWTRESDAERRAQSAEARALSLEAMNANLVATQGEELARIGVARECEHQEAEAIRLSLEGQVEGLKRALERWVALKDKLGADSYDGIEPAYAEELDELAGLTRAVLASLPQRDQGAATSFLGRRVAAPPATLNTAWDGDEGREGRREDEDEASPPQTPVSGDER